LINTLEGHTGSVLKIKWISLGLEIISSASDGTLKIWNVKK